VGDRHNAVRNRDAAPVVRDASKKEQWDEEDKEARKRAKKARRKTEQKERERARVNETVSLPAPVHLGAVVGATAATAAPETGAVRSIGAADLAEPREAEQLAETSAQDGIVRKARREAAGSTTTNSNKDQTSKRGTHEQETHPLPRHESDPPEPGEKHKKKKEKKERKRRSLLEAAGLASEDKNRLAAATPDVESVAAAAAMTAAQKSAAGADGADGGDRRARKKRKKEEKEEEAR